MSKNKIAVICGDDDSLIQTLKRIDDIEFVVSAPENLPTDSACVLVSQMYACERTDEYIKMVKRESFTVAVVTDDASEENQEALSDSGADDVLVMPIPQKLLRQRLLILCSMIVSEMNNEKMVITLKGRLDTKSAPKLETLIKTTLDEVNELCFDMNKLEYISSAGLRVLLSAQKIMDKRGRMSVTGCNDDIMKILDITGFSDILTIE